MKLKDVIKRQRRINTGRIKRAFVLLEALSDLDENGCDERAGAGYEYLRTLSKDEIINKYIDYLDLIMVGMTLTEGNDDDR